MVIAALLACSGQETEPPPPPPPPTGDTGPTTTHTGTAPGPDLVVGPDQVPTLSVTYVMSQTAVREGFDVLATWTGLTTDAWGEPFAATDPDTLLVLLEILAPPNEVARRLAHDDLGFDLLSVFEATTGDQTFLSLSSLRFEGDGVAFVPSSYLLENPEKSWVLGLGVREGERLHLRTATILVPDRDSQATSASLADSTASFSWTAAMGEPLVTSDRWDAFTVDWEAVTTDALGKPFDDALYDELVLGRFPAGTTGLANELDALEGAADTLWRLKVTRQTDAELALASGGPNGPFPGFTEGPVWAMWVRCTTCLTPFPAWVAEVEVR